MKNINLENTLKALNLEYPPIFDKKDHAKYVIDWREQYEGETSAVLRPIDTKEVSNIIKFAHDNNIAIVPQGGNTSLCGGATPDKAGKSLLISLEKMNKIRSFNVEAQTITVDAGVILSSIHERVEDKNLFFPLNLGAKGSCMIGGNLSTNAGGVNVLK